MIPDKARTKSKDLCCSSKGWKQVKTGTRGLSVEKSRHETELVEKSCNACTDSTGY